MAVCPECEAEVEIDELDVGAGDVISCPECGSDVKVVGVSPVELDRAAEGAEEWGT
jgi:alpha-aminoadipate/glutamate carrier protein LysW